MDDLVLRSPADVPDFVRRHHEQLSPLDWDLRQTVFTLGETPEAPKVHGGPDAILARDDLFSYHPWPILLGRHRWEQMGRDAAAITRLVKDVPFRLAGRYRAQLEPILALYPKSILDILLSDPTGVETAVCRGDFLFDGERLQLLELNASPNSGGWEAGEIGRRFRARPEVRAVLDRHGARAHDLDPLRFLFEHIATKGAEYLGLIAPILNTALVTPADQPMPFADVFLDRTRDLYRRVMEEHGLEGRLQRAIPADLTVEGGVLRVDGRAVHALVEDSVRSPPAAYRAFKGRKLALFNGPLEPILSDKRLVALLSEAAETDLYSAAERELVRRLVPRTRILVDDLRAEVLAHRESWVLKPARESSGRGVTLGHRVSDETWRRRVEEGLADGAWLAQERVRPHPFLSVSPTGGNPSLWHGVWGIYVFGDRPGGVLLRMLPAERHGVISAGGDAVGSTVLVVGAEDPSGTMHRHDRT